VVFICNKGFLYDLYFVHVVEAFVVLNLKASYMYMSIVYCPSLVCIYVFSL
jgi:hypothetical protein